jgi:hypothetical protein
MMGKKGGRTMAIYRQLQHSSFGPDEIKVLTDAYESTLHKLKAG